MTLMKRLSSKTLLELQHHGQVCSPETELHKLSVHHNQEAFWTTFDLQDLCDANEFPVLALKAGRVSDFGGKSVSTISSSQLLLNPDRQETHDLRRWSEGEGRNVSPHSLSKEGGGVRTEVCKTIAEMKKDEGLGRGPKADYITLKAAIAFAKAENFCYKSCPNMTTEGKACQKKVRNMRYAVIDTHSWTHFAVCCWCRRCILVTDQELCLLPDCQNSDSWWNIIVILLSLLCSNQSRLIRCLSHTCTDAYRDTGISLYFL